MIVKRNQIALLVMGQKMAGIRIQPHLLFGFLKKYQKVRIQVDGVILYE